MTPNGAILLALTVIVAAMLSKGLAGLLILLAFCVAFGLMEIGGRTLKALAWSAALVLPLAVFLGIVWIGVVGRAPNEIAAGIAGSRTAAFDFTAIVCLRLFVVALAIQLAILRFAHLTPLQFIRTLAAPLLVKKLLALTLSLIDTILHAVDRSRTALIAAGIVTARPSLRNLGNGWILVQTAWLSVVTIAVGRVRDKWPTEHTLTRLDETLKAARSRPLAAADLGWLAVAIAVAATAFKVG